MRRPTCLLFVLCLAACLLAGCAPQSEAPQPAATPAPTHTPVEEEPAEPAYETLEGINPYTGLPQGENYPAGKRGVAVMINNVKGALPQSGINSADLLYEMVTEGGVTRLMAVYRDYANMPVVGPIRSARDQHVQLMLPLECLYAHIGGSTYANVLLDVFHCPGYRSLDGKYRNFYWIDQERRKTMDQDYCVYTDGPTLAAALEKFGLDTDFGYEMPQTFRFVGADEPARVLEDGVAKQVYLRFSGYTDCEFRYDETTGRYAKWEFGEPQVDEGDGGAQYQADNLFILFTEITKYPDGVLSQVDLSGQGYGYYFCDGRYERVRWMKGAASSPLRILRLDGTEEDVLVNPGQSYIAMVGLDQFEYFRIDDQPVE